MVRVLNEGSNLGLYIPGPGFLIIFNSSLNLHKIKSINKLFDRLKRKRILIVKRTSPFAHLIKDKERFARFEIEREKIIELLDNWVYGTSR